MSPFKPWNVSSGSQPTQQLEANSPDRFCLAAATESSLVQYKLGVVRALLASL